MSMLLACPSSRSPRYHFACKQTSPDPSQKAIAPKGEVANQAMISALDLYGIGKVLDSLSSGVVSPSGDLRYAAGRGR